MRSLEGSCVGQNSCCLGQVVETRPCCPSIGCAEKVFRRAGQPTQNHQGMQRRPVALRLPSHPTAGRRRRRKSPAAVGHNMHDLALPSLPDRMRSASTTPRSVRGTDPNEYDRVMGVTSVGSRETVRFGEEDISGPDRKTRMELLTTQLTWMKHWKERICAM